jgi:DNA-binding MarR family transcriptional regulator
MATENDNPSNRYPDVDRLIHAPSRYNIMALLYVVERAEYLFVLHHTKMTSGNLTAHLTKLEKAGYLRIQKKFVRKKPKTFLSLTPRGRKSFERYRQQMKRLFNAPPDIPGEQLDTDSENGG